MGCTPHRRPEREASQIDLVFAASSVLTPLALGTMAGAVASGACLPATPRATSGGAGSRPPRCSSACSPSPPPHTWRPSSSAATRAASGAKTSPRSSGAGRWSAASRRAHSRWSGSASSAPTLGWGIVQEPFLLPGLTVEEAAAGHATLLAITFGVLGGSIVLFPSLALLFRMVLRGGFDPMTPTTPTTPGDHHGDALPGAGSGRGRGSRSPRTGASRAAERIAVSTRMLSRSGRNALASSR